MILDPLYIIMMIPCLLFGFYASYLVKSTFKKYSTVGSSKGYTGAEAARIMLEKNNIFGVSIEETSGFLSDHYDPRDKSLRLSRDVYHGQSLAAIGVACHEAGHAIQDAHNYSFLGFRSMMVPLTGIGSTLGFWIMFAGIIMAFKGLAMVGLILFSATAVFTFVTLPVEWDASARAKKAMVGIGLLSPSEQAGASKVLNAAFLTYIAAFVASLVQVIYWAMIIANDR